MDKEINERMEIRRIYNMMKTAFLGQKEILKRVKNRGNQESGKINNDT